MVSTAGSTTPVERAEPVVSPPSWVRLDGLDAARALAFAGMLLAHFAFSMRADDPQWLRSLDEVADGRAAPLFCVLLGLGAGLLVARGTKDRVLVVRGLLLVALGLAIWPFVGRVYLILPHYGVLLALIPLLRRLSTAWLLPAATLAFAIPSATTALVDDHLMRSAPQPDAYVEMADAGHLLRMLVWTGGYPLVGWVGFALVGLWLSRLSLRRRAVQVRLLLGGAAVALLQPLLAWALDAVGGLEEPEQAGGWGAFLDGSAHSNRMAWYVLASATAVAAVGGCLLLFDGLRGSWRTPIVRLGQLALTVYLVHLFLGNQWVWPWLDRARPALTTQMLVVLVVLTGLTSLATVWRLWFRRGPVESALRAVSH